jgi:hypothetical protein
MAHNTLTGFHERIRPVWAGNARREFEAISDEPVVSPVNYKQLQRERQRELQPQLFDQSES